jgi:hypothetical protein
MRGARFIGSGLLALSLVLLGTRADGGQRKLGDIVKDIVETLDKITSTLATIKDEGTAKAAVPDLRKAAARFKELRGEAEKARPPSNEEADRLKKEYRDKIKMSKGKLDAEVKRVRQVPGGDRAYKEIILVIKKAKSSP